MNSTHLCINFKHGLSKLGIYIVLECENIDEYMHECDKESLPQVEFSSDQPFKPHILLDTPLSWYSPLHLKVATEPKVVFPVSSVNSPLLGL